MRFSSVSENNLGRGIDSRSSENLIPPGFSEDILNARTINTRLAKREGYQLYAGCLPLRVAEVKYDSTTQKIKISFDGIVDLSSKKSTPVVIYGRTNLNSHGGDFNLTDTGVYYDTIAPQVRDSLVAPSGTIKKSKSERPITDPIFITGIALSTNGDQLDNEVFIPDAVRQDKTTDDLFIDYSISSNAEAFTYFAGKTALPGKIYVDDAASIDGTGTLTITGSTHSLDNFTLSSYFYRSVGNEWQQVFPNSVTINQTTGDLVAVFNGLSNTTVRAIVTSLPGTNIINTSVAPNASFSVNIPNASSPYIFVTTFITDNAGNYEQVFPDKITYDPVTRSHTVTGLNSSSSIGLVVAYEYGKIAANSFTVTSKTTITASGVDTKPQMTVWGLCHEPPIYGGLKSKREGWVVHLDSYRRTAEQRLISGLGGVLYAAKTRLELDPAYKLTRVYPYVRARSDAGAQTIGPLFINVGGTKRTSGWIESTDTTSNNELPVTTIAYNTSTGYVDVTLQATALNMSDPSISNIITAGTDIVTISGAGNARFNGDFTIQAVSATSNTITLSIKVDSVDSSIWDESNVGGLAAIYSDAITTDAAADILPNDTIGDDTNKYTVINAVGTKIFIKGVKSSHVIAGSARLTGTRKSRVIQTRDDVGNIKIDNLVAGDALDITGENGTYEIKYINTLSNESVTLTDDGTKLTISGISTTDKLIEGQSIILSQAGDYSGVHVITKTASTTSVEVASVKAGSGTGTLVGKTIEIDYDITWEDKSDNSNTIDVSKRWIPVEAPDDNYTLTPATHPLYFKDGDVSNKPLINSTIVSDNMYFTTGNDSVMKFDGQSIYRAGLFRWQPQAFISLDNSGGTIPTTNIVSSTITAVDGNRFTLPIADQNKFKVGQKIQHTNDNALYTITDIAVDEGANPPTQLFVTVNKTISGAAAGTLNSIQTFHYYFRLNAIDANQNIIASAVTGEQDIRVELGQPSGVRIRLIGMPAWDVYDYDRLEVEVYRSQADVFTEFRKVTTIGMSFNVGDGYIDILDTLADDNWVNQPLDPVGSALLGAELGTGWSEPIRAKKVSSANNRLVLANIKSYPRLKINILPSTSEPSISDLSGLIWEFKRTNNTSSGVTDGINRIRFEYISSGAVTINPATDIANNSNTSFTVTKTAHGLSAGDWVYMFHSSAGTADKLTFAGWFQIASADANTFTINQKLPTGYTPSAADVDSYVTATNSKDIPVWLGADGNMNYISAKSSLIRLLAGQRLGYAINAVMRMADTGVSGWSTFEPWLIADSGGEFAAGEVIVRQPKIDDALDQDETFELVVPNYGSNLQVYINDVLATASSEQQAIELVFPSRLLVSYPNFPELFDNPLAQLPEESDSVIDINPSDGQEITAIIPFFGDSTFGTGQKEGHLIVFKSNSIYLVSVNAKAQGASPGLANPIQKLESRGIGCTAPNSVAKSKDGIMFAHDSGIYVLSKNLTVQYAGWPMERFWNTQVNKKKLDLVSGHSYSLGNQYKLSVPISTNIENSDVYVYDYSIAQSSTDGNWFRYDNHNAVWWANLESDAFFCSTNGKVLQIRRTGLESDFRDENKPIKTVITLRAVDFGLSSLRKLVTKVLVHFRNQFPQKGTVIEWDTDLEKNFRKLPSFSLDAGDGSVVSVRFDLKRSRGIYFQLRITNDAIDEPLELSGVEWRVGGLSAQGTKEAQNV